MDHCRRANCLPLMILALFVILNLTGCSEDEPVTVGTYSLDSLYIICNPICPTPGETAVLSVRVMGSSSGSWPSYSWSVSDGALAGPDEAVTEWAVPEQTGDYTASLTVNLDAQSRNIDKIISVRNYEILDTGRRFNLYPNIINGEIFFVSPYTADISFNDPEYVNSLVMKYEGSGSFDVITDGLYPLGRSERGGDWFFFTDDGSKVVASMITDFGVNFNLQHKNVAAYNLSGSGGALVTNSLSGVVSKWRFDQYRTPFPNSDGSMVAMQYLKAGEDLSGLRDMYNIAFWKSGYSFPEVLVESTDTTFVQGDSIFTVEYYENILPMITPDETGLIFFSNKSGLFEPSVMPIMGGEPDTSDITYYEDTFRDLGLRIVRNTIFEWQPNGSKAAFIGLFGGRNTLCFMNYSGGSIDFEITDITGVSEFAWSPQGDWLAIISDDGAYIAEASGQLTEEILKKESSTDLFIGINWSPVVAEPKVGFRVCRQGNDWYEAFNALMVYVVDDVDPVLSYVTPGIDWPNSFEPSSDEFDFRWKRVIFETDGEGIYSPVTIGVLDDSGEEEVVYGSVRIVHSWK